MAQVSYGTITITDTNDIEKIYMEYAQSTSNQTAPTSGWDTDIPIWQQGKYIWQRTVTKMSGVALSSDNYGEPVCLTGSTGSTGAAGRSVSSIVTTYCNYGDGTPADNYSGWQSTVPVYDSTKPNYWVKTVITYSNPTETSTTKYKDNGITSATSTAAAANSTAQTANQTANEAKTTAGEAKTIAEGASSAISDLNQYFWRQKTAATNVPAGSYVTNVPGTTYKNNPASGGFNSLVQATGIFLRNGITTLSSWTGDALTFNNPSTGNAQLIIGANGTLQSGNYSYTSGQIFSASGTKIDLTDGTIYSPYFRILTSALGDNQPGAYIKGDVVARTGRFGSSSDNYWLIDTYYDAEEEEYYSSLRGIGKSFIQLGSTNTWTLGTDRINSSWRYISTEASGVTNPFLLRYKRFGTTSNDGYYDYGMNLPTILNTSDQNAKRIADKFLYIRTANYVTDSGLANLDLDSSWTYPFYVDSQGNVRARAFYVGNSTTAIGGGAGTIAEKLTQGYGSASQPIYVQSDGTPKEISYTIQTSVPTGALFTDTWKPLTTSQAGYVPVKAPNSTSQFLRGDATWAAVTKSNVGLGNVENVALSTWAGSSSLTTTKVGTLAEAATRGVDTSIGAASTSTKLPTSAAVAAFVEGKGYKTTDNNTTYSLTQDSSNGHKITLTPSSGTAQTITIPDNNTTYTFANGTNGFTVTPSGGTAQTVTVTPSITNNITGSGTSGYLTKFTGTNTIGNGPALSSTGTRYLKEDGTWGTPGGTYSLPTASSSTLGGIKVGSGLSISEEVLSHSDTSSQASSSNSGRTYIQSITLDTYGHVTGLSTATETVTNTHNTAYLYAGKSDGTANAATTNGNTYLILMDGGSATTRRKISGSGTVSVASDANGNITITGSAHPTSLKNPNALTVNVYNATTQTTSGYSTTTYDGSVANQSVNVAGNNAITKITSNEDGQLVVQRASGAAPETVTVKITATTSDTSASADKLNLSADVGSLTQPVYFDGNTGLPVATTYSLNKTVPSDAVFTDTWIAMVGATSSANGTAGYVSAPPKDGYNTKFLRADGTWVVPGGTYSLPLAANGTRGGVQIGYTTSGKNYAVQLSNEKMYVNVPWTDRYVNSASFADDTTNSTTSPLKMTLTRAGSDTNTITASLPKVSSSTAGVAPKGASVSTQSQSTKFLREDGTWAAPSYTTNTNTATAVDNILDGSNSGTAITYAPYSAQQSKLSFDTSTTAPTRTDRLNLNGYLYATKLYSGGNEVLTSHQDISGKIDTAGTGLSKSGTTLNHSNSVTAQTTQAVYPIKIDAQGHISGYGSAQTILSLGTSSNTAYRGDYGNTAYTHATDSGRLTTAKSSGFYKFSVTAHGHVGSVTAVAGSDITGLLSFGTAYNASSNKIATISDVTSAISGATNKYVTLDTDQTLVANGTKKYLGLQTYGSNGIAFGVTSGTSITQKTNVKYDSSLDALVFSFA